MNEGEEIAFNGLEICSYRHLQVVAKQLGLPSNVKKVHLIEMIRAKKYCSESDLQVIVGRVKMERKVNAQVKRDQKKINLSLQAGEVSSTSTNQSPPISVTPKRSNEYTVRNSHNVPQSICQHHNTAPNIVQRGNRSDRVLRSSHCMKRPNYRILDQSDCVVMKSTNTVREIRYAQELVQKFQRERMKEMYEVRAYNSVDVALIRPRSALKTLLLNNRKQLVPVITKTDSTSPQPAKRQRKISGIFPLQPQEIYKKHEPPVVKTDGRVTKINAVIQKPLASTLIPRKILQKNLNRRNSLKAHTEITIQDVINYQVGNPSSNLTTGKTSDPRVVVQHNQSENNKFKDYQKESDTQEIYPYQDSVPVDDQNDVNAVKLSYQGKTLINIVPEMPRSNQSIIRRVYKNRQISRDADNSKNDWIIYDMNDKPLMRNSQITTKTFTHSKVKPLEPVSTNYKVKQGRISAPVGRDQSFDYERMERNIEHARNMDYARNSHHSDYQDVAEKIVDYSQARDLARKIINDKHADYSVVNYGENVDHYQNTIDNAEVNNATNIEPAKTDHAKIIHDDRNMVIYSHSLGARHNVKVYENNYQEQNRQTELFYPENNNIDLTRNEVHPENNGAVDTEMERETQYPNMPCLSDVIPNDCPLDTDSQNNDWVYNNQIGVDQDKKVVLPRIKDVFSKFNDEMYQKLTQPLYVNVSEESERVDNTCMLENLVNFKNKFLTNTPVFKIGKTIILTTMTTLCTKTITTAIAQPCTAQLGNHYNPYVHGYFNESCAGLQSRFYNHQRANENQMIMQCDEVLTSSTCTVDSQPLEQSPDPGASPPPPGPSPEMVEDALELISQDGDYMERIGMDVRVQCIICNCNWAGPKFILEYHIKKDHPTELHHSDTESWTISLPLGSLSHAWASRLLQSKLAVYALSAKYADDTLSLALSAIPNEIEIPRCGKVTVYNQRTGKPFSYESEIKVIPDSMPYEYDQDCLNIYAASLDLPNSANLRLVSKLDGSPNAGLGTKRLNNVEIVVYVNLLD